MNKRKLIISFDEGNSYDGKSKYALLLAKELDKVYNDKRWKEKGKVGDLK